jgi:hypothetical protein
LTKQICDSPNLSGTLLLKPLVIGHDQNDMGSLLMALTQLMPRYARLIVVWKVRGKIVSTSDKLILFFSSIGIAANLYAIWFWMLTILELRKIK